MGKKMKKQSKFDRENVKGPEARHNNGGNRTTATVHQCTSNNITPKRVSFVSSLSDRFIGHNENGKWKETDKMNSNPTYYQNPSGRGMRSSPSMATLNRIERQKIVFWCQPMRTVKYSIYETAHMMRSLLNSVWKHKYVALFSLAITFALCQAYHVPGYHQALIKYLERKLLWCMYWIGLGVLSSVGFGYGLHTFLLYLGPHIASVTLAAYECDSLKFPEPPYPDKIICPDALNDGMNASNANDNWDKYGSKMVLNTTAVTLWAIISKVRLEAFMWGAGTALGELPPYFMARAARLTGDEPDDEEYREFMLFVHGDRPRHLTIVDKVKMAVERFIETVGFPGILLCASIPNPFFDLAGITCGHFLVPFWTFFGATLLGKAAVKMHIQMLFVVIAFSEHHVEVVVNLLKHFPLVGECLQTPIKDYLEQQKLKMHRRLGDPIQQKSSLLQDLMALLLLIMIFYFFLSIINSLAQAYHKRLCQKERAKNH